MENIAAIVPMKGHSERVPGKNIRDFNGKPLFYHILSALSQSRHISAVYVDTDSNEIAGKVRKFFLNVSIIERPEHLRGDFVSMNDVLAHDLTQIEAQHILQTHTTNPLLQTSTIDKAIEAFFGNAEYDSLFSATRWQTRLYDSDRRPVNHDLKMLLRTQDLPPVYEENSNLYIFSKDSFAKTNARIGEYPYIFEVDRREAIDIDEELDFLIAEFLQRKLMNNSGF